MGGSADTTKRHKPTGSLSSRAISEMASWSVNVYVILRAVREGGALRVGVVRKICCEIKISDT